MKSLICIVLFILATKVGLGQTHAILSQKITNPYLTEENSLAGDSVKIFKLQKNVFESRFGYEGSKNLRFYTPHLNYYQITKNQTEGVIQLSFNNIDISKSSIEAELKKYYDLFQAGDSEEKFIKEIIKTPSLHAAFLFRKGDSSSYMFIYAKGGKKIGVRSTLDMYLPDAEKAELIRDFIKKTVFK